LLKKQDNLIKDKDNLLKEQNEELAELKRRSLQPRRRRCWGSSIFGSRISNSTRAKSGSAMFLRRNERRDILG
jgi:hypothetical protein